MATAHQAGLGLRRYGQEKHQNQRGKEESAEGQGGTYLAGSTELALLPHSTTRGRAVHVRCRHRAKKQQTQESREGDQTSPRGSMLRLVHEARKQT
jgi:hypothetical protein